jgi:hypothetical protein
MTSLVLPALSAAWVLGTAGCGQPAATRRVDPAVHQALLGTTTLTLQPAAAAAYSAAPDQLIFEQARHDLSFVPDEVAEGSPTGAAIPEGHWDQHLDVWEMRNARLELTPGAHLSGGHAYDLGRFDDGSAFTPSGALRDDAYGVWAHFVVCHCDGTARDTTYTCEGAHRIELDVEAASREGWVRVSVQGYREGATEPFAVGRFEVPPQPADTVTSTPGTPGEL